MKYFLNDCTFSGLAYAVTPTPGTNTTQLATTAFVEAAVPNSSYRTLLDSSGSLTAGQPNSLYMCPQGQPLIQTGVGTAYPPNIIYLDPADYPTVDGITAKLRVRCVLCCNDVPASMTITMGLYPISRPTTSGGAGVDIYTVGTVVTGSTITQNPGADSMNNKVGVDFVIPTAGFYVLGVSTAGGAAVPASCHLQFSMSLQLRNA